MDKHISNTADGPADIQPFTLFIPTGTKNYSVRFSIPGHGQQRFSLGTPIHSDAIRLAWRKYVDATQRAEDGLLVKNKSVQALAAEWLNRSFRQDTAQKIAQREYVTNRYVVGFFGDKLASAVNDRAMASYQDWRDEYWLTGPGAAETHREYRRGNKTVRMPITAAMRRVPAPSTRNSENVILREFFTYLARNGHIKQVPVFDRIKGSVNQRPSFDDAELRMFTDTVKRRLRDAEPMHRFPRFVFWAFTEIMVMSGLRDTEALHLKWSDIVNFTMDQNKTIMHDFEIALKIHGKNKSRTCIPLPGIIHPLQNLYDEYTHYFKKQPEPDSFVFLNRFGERATTFKKSMNDVLVECNLTTDYRGVKRTSYVFRHRYITQQLIDETNIHFLARNTGTSVAMIEQHYSHVSLQGQRDKLIPERWRE